MGPDPVFTAPTLQTNETYTTNPKGMWWVCGDGMGSIKYTLEGHLIWLMVLFKLNIGFVKMDNG